MEDSDALAASLQRRRAALRTVETHVSTSDGRQFTEIRSIDGYYCTADVHNSANPLPLGFIPDTQPDLAVGQVYENLIFGSQDVAADRSLLMEHGVTHVLNLASGVPNFYPNEFIYQNWDLLDVPEAPLLGEHLTEACAFIDSGRSSGCVLVHCNAGVSRSAAVVVAYLMRSHGWSYSAAFEFVRHKRPRARPNRGFVQQLMVLEKQLSNSSFLSATQVRSHD